MASEREQIAWKISDFCSENHLTTPYGGYQGQKEDMRGKPHVVLFSKPEYLDEKIYVFSPNYISLSFHTRILDLPRQDTLIFESIQNVLDYLKFAFITGEFNKANKVPLKE